MNDNRNYNYDKNSKIWRQEYKLISDWIPLGSSVIDLGCGDGSLLKSLMSKKVTGEGIELTKSGVVSAKNKGLRVKQGRIDVPLSYKNKIFDYAICNVTLQMVMCPEVLLLEMRRIAKHQIVSFPNFAFLPNRLDLLINGRMPKILLSGYQWYSTGHIHQLSICDFEKFCKDHNMTISDKKNIFSTKLFFVPKFLMNRFPNLFAGMAVYLL